MRLTIGDYLIYRLRELGIDRVIGVPGDYNLQFLEQLEAAEGCEFVGATNELNAAYAADGYARQKGMGALLTTYGVGELSALNGVAGAAAEHVPVVHIVGAPPLFASRERWLVHHTLADGDFDNTAAAAGAFVAATARLTPENAVTEIDRVLRVAMTQSRPVYLQLPANISYLPAQCGPKIAPLAPPPAPECTLPGLLDNVERLYQKATRPVMLVDLDAARRGLAPQLEQLVQTLGIPYVQLVTGKAILSESAPGFLGTYNGALSAPAVKKAVEEADWLLTFAPRFIEGNSGQYTHKLPPGTISIGYGTVRVGAEDGTGGGVYEGVDAAAFLQGLCSRLRPRPRPEAPARGAAQPPALDPDEPLSQEGLWPQLAAFVQEGDTVICEMGTANLGMGPQALPDKVTWMASSIWGSIGFTLPCLFGSLLAAPERRHVLCIGDGSFQLTATELSSIIRHGQQPIIFVINNRGYTIERWILGEKSAYNDIANWRYTDLPRVFAGQEPAAPGGRELGLATYVASTNGQLHKVLAEISASGRGAFVELRLDPFDAPAALRAFGPTVANFDFGPHGPRNQQLLS